MSLTETCFCSRLYGISFSEISEEPLVECNDDDDCPKILSRCNKMNSPTPSGKEGYCVLPACQWVINANSSKNELNCPTIGNVCTVGSLTGQCIRTNVYTCRYEKALVIAKCGKKEIFSCTGYIRKI